MEKTVIKKLEINHLTGLPLGKIIKIIISDTTTQDCFGSQCDCVNWSVWFIPKHHSKIYFINYTKYPSGNICETSKLRVI